ncbi:hypothetical protein Taro_017846 [Colocasia esculenta]|uniref:Uncharacterized protein n=1 Tax=Colocasia esculenta TaxID=4460 RepID=A0A843USD9_COLES|nr:hypothetical protein [Colocasia esculenta]
MVEHLKGVWAETVRKRADREMQERIISGRQRDEDDDDEPEIYAEHVPDQPLRQTREQTRQAVSPGLGARSSPVDFPMWRITSLIFQPKSQS